MKSIRSISIYFSQHIETNIDLPGERKEMTAHLSCIFNIMVADDLVTLGAKASSGMIWTYSSCNLFLLQHWEWLTRHFFQKLIILLKQLTMDVIFLYETKAMNI